MYKPYICCPKKYMNPNLDIYTSIIFLFDSSELCNILKNIRSCFFSLNKTKSLLDLITKSVEGVLSVQSVQCVHSVQCVQFTECAQCFQSVQSFQSDPSVQSVQSVQRVQCVQCVRGFQCVQSVQ